MCRLEKYVGHQREPGVTERDRVVENADQLRMLEMGMLKNQVLPIVGVLYGKMLCDTGRLNHEKSIDIARETVKNLGQGSRRQIIEFIENQTNVFSELVASNNPGSNESGIAFATRRLALIEEVMGQVSDGVNGQLIVDIVDIYIGVSKLDVSGVSVMN